MTNLRNFALVVALVALALLAAGWAWDDLVPPL